MADLVGKTLKNRYKVVESLGRGGMADVYKVWDEERAVYLAMKVLRQDLAQDPIFLRRFQREARALAALQHPHIVRFYGLERDDLLAFLLMEYVDGVSLQAEILRSEGKPLPMEHIREVMEAVCSALHYAHHQGLVHCDIKPGNILIDKHGQIYLTDFGIARGMDMATSTMVGIGTPAYMAPELIKGQDPTPQTDIYALGIVLYEMLTGGERPFTGERATITGTTADKVRWEHLKLDPVPISQFNKTIGMDLQTLVYRCLQKEPAKRFKNIQELIASLNSSWKNINPEFTNDRKNNAVIKKTKNINLKSDLIKIDKEKKPPIETLQEKGNGSLEKSVMKKNYQKQHTNSIVALLISIPIIVFLFIKIPKMIEENNENATQTAQMVATNNTRLTSTAIASQKAVSFQETENAKVYALTGTAEVVNNKKAVDLYSDYLTSEEMRKIKSHINSVWYENSGKIIQEDDIYLEIYNNLYHGDNFILDVTFSNPQNSDNRFDYGVLFGGHYRLILQPNDQYCELQNSDTFERIYHGNLQQINKGALEKNRILLIVIGTEGKFYINDVLIDSFSLENDVSIYADLFLGTDFFFGDSVDNRIINYGKFRIISFSDF